MKTFKNPAKCTKNLHRKAVARGERVSLKRFAINLLFSEVLPEEAKMANRWLVNKRYA